MLLSSQRARLLSTSCTRDHKGVPAQGSSPVPSPTCSGTSGEALGDPVRVHRSSGWAAGTGKPGCVGSHRHGDPKAATVPKSRMSLNRALTFSGSSDAV